MAPTFSNSGPFSNNTPAIIPTSMGGTGTNYGAKRYLTINALGDSVSNQGLYFPYGAGLTSTYALANGTYGPVVPDWVTGTTYPTNGLCKNGTRIYYNNAGGVAGATPPTGGGNSDGTITWFVLDPPTPNVPPPAPTKTRVHPVPPPASVMLAIDGNPPFANPGLVTVALVITPAVAVSVICKPLLPLTTGVT